ncbi:MAG: peptidylprolyl isomerase [bacterium]
MKTHLFFTSAALACGLIFAACSPTDPSHPNFVVAQGKGVKITRGELTAEREKMLEHMKRPGMEMPQMSEEEKASLDGRILDRMITKKLVEAETAKISSSEINKKVEESFNKIKGRFPDEKTFLENIGKAGMTPDKIKESIKAQVGMEKLVETRLKPEDLDVSPEEVEKFYKDNPQFWNQPEQVRARHILIRVEPSATEAEKAEKKKAAEAARARISKGEPFAKVAEEVSDDPGSKQRGGELPPFAAKGQMLPEFSEAAFKQKVGVVGSVFESKFGYHFVEVLERIAPRTVPFEEVKGQIEQRLKGKKRFEGMRKVMQQLRDDAQVEVKIQLPKPPVPPAAPGGVPGAQPMRPMQQQPIPPVKITPAPAQPQVKAPVKAKEEKKKK